MITVQEIVDQLKAKLQSEGNDRWDFDRDFKFAISGGIDYLTSVINSIAGAKKFNSELFRELTHTSVFRTNIHGRIEFNAADLGAELWSVVAVMPKCTMYPAEPVFGVVLPQDTLSYYIKNVYVESDYDCKRLNLGEWNTNKFNPFYPGNVKQNPNVPELWEFAYLDFTTYTAPLTGSQVVLYVTTAIEVRPFMSKEFCGVSYVLTHPAITSINDNILFPDNMRELIIRASLRELAIKEGNANDTIYSISTADMQAILNSVS